MRVSGVIPEILGPIPLLLEPFQTVLERPEGRQHRGAQTLTIENRVLLAYLLGDERHPPFWHHVCA